MPTLSIFHGIKIQMFWRDHPPPHFHAKAAGVVVVIDIQTLRVLRGELPPDLMKLVLQWAKLHQPELMEAWKSCSKQEPPRSITPLP